MLRKLALRTLQRTALTSTLLHSNSTTSLLLKRTSLVKRHLHHSSQNIYTILGISTSASREELKSKFNLYIIENKLHPDRGGDSARFRLLLEARDKALARWKKPKTTEHSEEQSPFEQYMHKSKLLEFLTQRAMNIYLFHSFIVDAKNNLALVSEIESLLHRFNAHLTNQHIGLIF